MDLGGLRWVTRSLRKASWWKFLEHLEPFARHLKVWRPRRIFCHFLFMQVPSLISFIEFGYKCQTTHTLKQNIAAQKICYILIHHVTDTKIPLVCPGSIAFEGTMCFHFWWLRLHQGNRDKCISKLSRQETPNSVKIKTKCVTPLCEHSICDHSMCDHSMWALYV